MKATLEKWPAPHGAKVQIKVEVAAEIPISAASAQEIADNFLLLEVGDLLSAGEPSLCAAERLKWEGPILLSNAAQGELGEVGRLRVDAETGAIEFTEQHRREVQAHAQALSELAASSADR